MYTILNTINNVEYNELKASKLLDINAKEILLISLEKGNEFPKHTSPRDAHLIVLEGDITFYINNTSYQLQQHTVFNFPKNEEHKVNANQNSKFLIIR